MLIVGLTGGIATGKSSVATVFEKLGAKIIDADSICRDLVHPGSAAWQEIVEAFGESVLTSNRNINRKKLGEIIFRDSEKKELLNSILHPKIINEEKRRVNLIRKEEPHAIVAINAALLVESGNYKEVDLVVVVTSSEESMINRMVKRDKISKEEALLRIKAQMPAGEKIKYADYVIENNGTMTELRKKAVNLFEELKNAETLKPEYSI